MVENSLEGVARIARNAIEEIDRLVRRQSSVASTPNSNASNSSHVLTNKILIKPNLANILLRSIASIGCVYVRLFADDLDDESDLMTNPFDTSSGEVSGTALRSLDTANMEESTEHTGRIDLTSEEEGEKDISDFVEEIIKECQQNQNTTEILRVAQNRILTGRPLDITDTSREITGETNYILVDRNNILETGISEISTITNFRLPIEVNFIGEAARDYGGPRRDVFRLVLIHIKETLFDGGLRPDLAEQYMPVGIIMGLSVLQNGKIPKFMGEEIRVTLFGGMAE